MTRGRRVGWSALAVALMGAGVLAGVTATGAQGAVTSTSFEMVRSTAAVTANGVPNA
jgi:hypothetical protein